jgi:PAS domain S-box-containing protein
MIQFLEGLGASIGIAVARQQAAKTLSENEARYRTLVESIPQKIFLKDRDSRFVTVNENFARELGIRPEEVAGKTDYDFFPKEFADKYRADDTRVMATGKTEELEERVGVAGPEIWVHTIKTPVHNDQGEVTGVFGIYWDITERKQLEESLLRSQRMEGIGSLAGGIAHDLNNILTPILLIAPFLRAEADASERNILVDTVESSAQRGADIIKQLLTFARGKPGARIIVPVRLLLQEMGQVIRETFPRNIQFHLTPPADLWPAFGDPTQFHQAILNLCVNARDAMPGGGTLTLGASNVHVDQGFVATLLEARPGAYLCVSVADTGTGIPPEHLHRIFDPFFTTKEVGKGTGLGLSTLLGIMRGHEGFIRVDTKPGRGTTFELYFPALPEAKEIAAPKPDAPPPHGQGELILVVDDEPDVIRIVELGLKKRGYRVVAAREGREALAVFASHRAEIKAVLTDMMMPGMDGPELVRALRQMNAQMPILGMTGLGELADTAKLEDLNLAEVLHKPFSASHMLATLHHALAQPM